MGRQRKMLVGRKILSLKSADSAALKGVIFSPDPWNLPFLTHIIKTNAILSLIKTEIGHYYIKCSHFAVSSVHWKHFFHVTLNSDLISKQRKKAWVWCYRSFLFQWCMKSSEVLTAVKCCYLSTKVVLFCWNIICRSPVISSEKTNYYYPWGA